MLGLSQLSHPESWWTAFSLSMEGIADYQELYKQLSGAIERFPVDMHRQSPALANIWKLNQDSDECRRLFKWLMKSMHPSTLTAQFYVQYSRLETSSMKAMGVLTGALDAFTEDPPNYEIIRKAMMTLQTTGSLPEMPSILERPRTTMGAFHHNKSSFNQTPPIISGMPVITSSGSTVTQTKSQNSNPLMMTPASVDKSIACNYNNNIPFNGVMGQQQQHAITSSSSLSFNNLPNNNNTNNNYKDNSNLTTTTTNVRRLGLAGPPKRVIPSSIEKEESKKREIFERRPEEEDEMDDQMSRSPTENLSNKTGKGSISMKLADSRIPDKDNDETNTMAFTSGSITAASLFNNTTTNAIMTTTIKKNSSSHTGNNSANRIVKVNGRAFKILQLIGRGGSSKVYKVLALTSSNNNSSSSSENPLIYALKKVSLKGLDQGTIDGYVNEISLLQRFADSPFIIKLYDYELLHLTNQLLLLMECGDTDLSRMIQYVHGTKTTQSSLSSSSNREKEVIAENQLDNGGQIDLNFVRYYFGQMLQAVNIVHVNKIVHCDLKPANFLLVQGKLKLIDFGISKVIPVDGNTTNVLREHQVGTVNYMSPEALQESTNYNSTDPKSKNMLKMGRPSDIWSLGCILYEMAFGRPPFALLSLVQRLQRIMDPAGTIDFPIDHPLTSHTDLIDCIRGCLIRTPKVRYTLSQLWEHSFLRPLPLPPHSLSSPNPSLLPSLQNKENLVIISKDQINELCRQIASKCPGTNSTELSERLWELWRRKAPSPPPPSSSFSSSSSLPS